MASELHDVVAGRFTNSDQRYTSARRSLVEVLAQSRGPISIQELLVARPQFPQSSIYRNLTALEQAGVIRRVAGSDDFGRFELAEEFSEHHHHLVCRSCGSVEDNRAGRAVERALDRAAMQIENESGFLVDTHQLDLMGLCKKCRKKTRGLP